MCANDIRLFTNSCLLCLLLFSCRPAARGVVGADQPALPHFHRGQHHGRGRRPHLLPNRHFQINRTPLWGERGAGAGGVVSRHPTQPSPEHTHRRKAAVLPSDMRANDKPSISSERAGRSVIISK